VKPGVEGGVKGRLGMDQSGFFGAAMIAFGILIAILWILLPFAVFGIKKLLTDILAEQKKLNAFFERYNQANARPR
jgi:protein-S-isoprenylcysteine O-methyltransferase Ste14